MAALKVLICLCIVALAQSAPGFHKKHEHVVVHVPYKVHTVHHHHVEKVPIYKEYPVIKHVPVYKEVIKHVPVYKEVIKHVPVYKEIIKHVPVPVHHHHEHEHEHKHIEEHVEHKDWSSSW